MTDTTSDQKQQHQCGNCGQSTESPWVWCSKCEREYGRSMVTNSQRKGAK